MERGASVVTDRRGEERMNRAWGNGAAGPDEQTDQAEERVRDVSLIWG